jgi:CRP-like cAMP-binding protein
VKGQGAERREAGGEYGQNEHSRAGPPGDLVTRRVSGFDDSRSANRQIGNRILASLPVDESNRLLPYLGRVRLDSGKSICVPNQPLAFAYFPNSGMISMVAMMRDGATVEVGMVGREGFVSTAVLLGIASIPNRAVVQIEGDAFTVEPILLRKLLPKTPCLESMLRHYTNSYWNQVAQVAACNRLHRVLERLARWLLMSRDRTDSDLLPLTQEVLAQMLGCRRSSVAAAMGSLEKAGVVRCGRGQVRIADRRELEKTACECYDSIRELTKSWVRHSAAPRPRK